MKYTIEIASVPDKENLVAEIWIDGTMIAEISQDGVAQVEFLCGENQSLVVDFALLIEALQSGLKKLISE